jgi:hypothetical protein
MGLQPESLLAAVEAWANARLRQLPPQALTLALGTFARLGGPRSPSLLASAEECVTSQLGRFEPAQLALVRSGGRGGGRGPGAGAGTGREGKGAAWAERLCTGCCGG